MTNYPRPKLPNQPILTSEILFPDLKKRAPSIADAPYKKYVTSGRMAIALALENLQIQSNKKVLIPAYHCSSMVEPVIWSGATPVFYRINTDTSINLDDIEKKLDEKTKALLVTHYFGFPQNMPAIRKFCDQHDLFLIEDCAHAYFGSSGGKPFGYYSDYAIASIMKFFPVYDGGCLLSYKHNLKDINLTRSGTAFGIKSFLNTLENSFEYRKLAILRFTIGLILKIKDIIWSLIKKSTRQSSLSIGPGASDGGYAFEPQWIHKKMSFSSKMIYSYANKNKYADLRKKTYLYLAHNLKQLNGIRLLFNELDNKVYPYVLPLYIEKPNPLFHQLKTEGIPIIRFGEFLWEGVDENTCPVSTDYSEHIFQIPVHQSLNKKDLDLIINTFKKYTTN